MSYTTLQNPFAQYMSPDTRTLPQSMAVPVPQSQPIAVPGQGKVRKTPEEILQRQRESQRKYRQQNKHRKYMQDYGLTEEEAKLYIDLQNQLKALRESGRTRLTQQSQPILQIQPQAPQHYQQQAPQTPIHELQSSFDDMSFKSQDSSEDGDEYEYHEE